MHNEGTFCTVLTDASWCPHEHVAGWAAWIVCNDQRYKRFDAFFDKCETAHEAEVKAILNGLTLAKRAFKPDHYHVVCDCISAMHELQGRSTSNVWRNKLLDIVGEARVTFKHVKAHTSGKDKRSYVNNWCDFQAKMAMRSIRNIKGESNND